MRVVSFFNHKGGVGKTTVLFNTAVALAESGQRVVLFDVDSQANLTALSIPEERYEEAISADGTIWSALSPLVTGAGDLRDVDAIKLRDNLWLVPGDIRLADFEAICPTGWTEALAGQARGFRVSSALFRLFSDIAGRKKAHFALVDLGPNVNALNRTALIASDGFIVPLAPDLFSVRALPSVGNSIAAWVREWQTATTRPPATIDFALPVGRPRPLGYITQQFAIYSGSPAAAYKKWHDKIPGAFQDGVLRPLGAAGIPGPKPSGALLASVQNLSSLVPTAQGAHKAIFELSGAQARGAHHTKAAGTRKLFGDLASRLNRLRAGTP